MIKVNHRLKAQKARSTSPNPLYPKSPSPSPSPKVKFLNLSQRKQSSNVKLANLNQRKEILKSVSIVMMTRERLLENPKRKTNLCWFQ
jgi:hypothetical protein